MTSTLAAFLSSGGWELLHALEARPDRDVLLGDRERLDRALRAAGVAPDVADGVRTQLDLRERARALFGDLSREMVLTREGLDRAPHLLVAALHAARLRSGGATRVADLGCGIGADALAMAGLGLGVLAVEGDEDAAAAAAVNLRAFPAAEVVRGDVRDLDPGDLVERGVDAVLADPMRGGAASHGAVGRTGVDGSGVDAHGPERWSPPLSLLLSWRGTFDRLGVTMPPDVPHQVAPPDCHVQWTSLDGDLVEAALWTPALAPEGPGRSALVLRDGHAHRLSDPRVPAPDSPVRPAPVGPLGAWVAEPDPAVLAAGLLARLAEDLGAHVLSPGETLLSGDDLPPTPLARRFEVLDVLTPPFRDPRGAPGGDVRVIRTRIAGRRRAVLARRCHN